MKKLVFYFGENHQEKYQINNGFFTIKETTFFKSNDIEVMKNIEKNIAFIFLFFYLLFKYLTYLISTLYIYICSISFILIYNF